MDINYPDPLCVCASGFLNRLFSPNIGPDKATHPWIPVAEGFEDLAEVFDDFGVFIYGDSDRELIIGCTKNDPLNSTNS